MYEETIEREYKMALQVPITRIQISDQEIVIFEAETLPAGVKTSVGKCLLAHYLDTREINNKTKSIAVFGGGNTVQAVKYAALEFGLNVDVVAIVYAETSKAVLAKLNRMGITVISDSPRSEGRDGRRTAAEKRLKQKKAECLFLEQHEQPLIIDIQKRTFGRAIVERLTTPPDHFIAGVGTGGTLFGIESALRVANPRTKITAVEGVGSTLTLWHAYMRVKGQGYSVEKTAIENALCSYEKAGMVVSLKCHPRNKNPEEWFEIGIDFPSHLTGTLGIEGLGVGDPTKLILKHLSKIDHVEIVTDSQARTGARALKSQGILAVESSGANFYAATKLAKKMELRGDYNTSIITVTTASR